MALGPSFCRRLCASPLVSPDEAMFLPGFVGEFDDAASTIAAIFVMEIGL